MIFRKLFMIVIAFGMILTGCGGTNEETTNNGTTEEKEIKIGLDPYDYSTVPVYISKEILEREGYKVDIQEGEVGILFASLAEGDIDVFMDIWAPKLHENYIERYGDQYEVIGTLYEDSPVGLAVPTFMEDVNTPEDLSKYKDEFDGTVYALEAGSGMANTTDKWLETYNLDYEVTNSSLAAMVAQASKMIDDKEPVVFNAWRPHTMFKMLDIKMLEDPKDLWGSDDTQVGAVFDLEEKAPEAYKLMSNMKLTMEEIEEWLYQVETDGTLKPEDLAKTWVDENQDRIKQWME